MKAKLSIETMNQQQNSKRIAKNAALLYFRLIFTMLVALYTSRVILNVLGESDFGIYNVVGGIVAMFSMFSGAFSSAITRFLTFEMGKGNYAKLRQIFSTSISIQIVLSLFIIVFGEVVGQWFIYNKMTIDLSRMDAAVMVLHFSLLNFAVNLLSVPYNAAIIAHEDMKAFAYIGVFEVCAKLFIVYLLVVISYDKLVVYGGLLLFLGFIIRCVYALYCNRYEECKFSFCIDRALFKEMGAFVLWNSIGVTSAALRSEGVNILINVFFSPSVNAARGISFQVNSAITQFSNNFMKAVNPQITKSYAAGETSYTMTLVFRSAKMSFFLLMTLTMALLVRTEYVMEIWLNIVPGHTVNFVKLMVVFTLLESISMSLITLMMATGRVKKYQLIVGGIILMILPICWLLLYLGYPPESTMIVYIAISLVSLIARLVLLQQMVRLNPWTFVKDVIFRCFVAFIFSYSLVSIVSLFIPKSFWGFSVFFVLSLFITILVVYLIGLEKSERVFVRGKVISMINSKLRR